MKFTSPIFDIEYSLERDGNTASVSGTIHNLLDREVATALLSFHFYDAGEVRVGQEGVFVNEIEPDERVRFAGAVVLGASEIVAVRLVKAEPIPMSDYPELSEEMTEPQG
jgi:hypothetical protein